MCKNTYEITVETAGKPSTLLVLKVAACLFPSAEISIDTVIQNTVRFPLVASNELSAYLAQGPLRKWTQRKGKKCFLPFKNPQ